MHDDVWNGKHVEVGNLSLAASSWNRVELSDHLSTFLTRKWKKWSISTADVHVWVTCVEHFCYLNSHLPWLDHHHHLHSRTCAKFNKIRLKTAFWTRRRSNQFKMSQIYLIYSKSLLLLLLRFAKQILLFKIKSAIVWSTQSSLYRSKQHSQ